MTKKVDKSIPMLVKNVSKNVCLLSFQYVEDEWLAMQ